MTIHPLAETLTVYIAASVDTLLWQWYTMDLQRVQHEQRWSCERGERKPKLVSVVLRRPSSPRCDLALAKDANELARPFPMAVCVT